MSLGMSLFGLSPLAFWFAAAGLGAAVLALHFLRVRLRTVEVDTLLFFRMAGVLRRPRVLPGRPARWLALALALAAGLAALTAIGEPRAGLDAPSRFVAVEPDPATHGERAEAALALARAGLGPRGVVLAATDPPAPLLAADEPASALRRAGLDVPPSLAGAQAALRALAAHLRAGDELVWLGAAPVEFAGVDVTHVAPARAPTARVRGLQWERGEAGAWTLDVQTEGDPLAVELRADGAVLARAEGAGALRLAAGALPVGTAVCTLHVGDAPPVQIPWPRDEPLRVHADASLPAEVAQAVAAVVAVDPELAEGDAASADVVVAATDDPADRRPRLVVTPGAGGGARLAVLGAGAPCALSLRDRARTAAPALHALADASVWVADAAQGDALVAGTAADAPRVFAVDWLLEPATHADVPVLLSSALRALGGRPRTLLALANHALEVPAGLPGTAATPTPVLPTEGVWPLRAPSAGVHEVAAPGGPRTVHVLRPELPAAPLAAESAPLRAEVGGDGSYTTWLLLGLLLLLTADAILFHRGRLP